MYTGLYGVYQQFQKYIFFNRCTFKKQQPLNWYNTLQIHESSAKFCSKAIIAVD